MYVVRGIYSGGKEGKSKIQWLRSMVGSPDLISIPGMDFDIYYIGLENEEYLYIYSNVFGGILYHIFHQETCILVNI